jgi:hypothetical protein
MVRDVLRTKTFATEAANFIVQRAREALDARGEFRIALNQHVFAGDLAARPPTATRMRNS